MESLFFVAAVLMSVNGVAGTTSLGTIEGDLLYPACTDVPSDLVVCGESQTGERSCTRPYLTSAGYAYRLELPAGNWRVYATAESARPGYRAYYSESVRCGLRADCVDHTPIAIDLVAGEIRGDVAPADWFLN